MSVVDTSPTKQQAPFSTAAPLASAPFNDALIKNTSQSTEPFKPKILAFTCKWCTYAGADLAGLNRMKYPADIRLLRVPCSGRVNPQFVLEALQRGCDGIIVCGCHPGDCHYSTGNYYAKRRMMIYKRLLEYIGLEPDRFQIRWISGAEAGKFRDVITEFCNRITELGPIENDFNLSDSIGAAVYGSHLTKPASEENELRNDIHEQAERGEA